MKKSRAEAITAWNTRALTPQREAAEEMYRALKEIKLTLGAGANDGKPGYVRESNVNHAWHLAHAAIAKWEETR